LFNVIDTNHDNSIDFNEFLFLAAVGNGTGSLEERLDIVFDLYVLKYLFK
jgi:Ca2+-binding EF-hand superfamily protein